MSNAGAHVLASGQMLLLRRPKPRNSSQEAVVFERVCVESFLYHAVLLTLFDPSVNGRSLTKGGLNLEDYLANSDHPDDAPPGTSTSTQPVLDASYKFFLFILEVTKLARSSPLLATSFDSATFDSEASSRSQDTSAHWETTIYNRQAASKNPSSENHVGKLYTVALRILLVLVEPRCSMADRARSIESFLFQGLEIIGKVAVDVWFSYYYLWPLLVVGSAATTPGEKQIVAAKLSQVSSSRPGGLISLAQFRLQKVWVAGSQCSWGSDRGQIVCRQLRTLLKGD